MTIEEALAVFGSKVAIARICKCGRANVSHWPPIPAEHQYKLMLASGGRLAVDAEHLPDMPQTVQDAA